MTPSIAGLATRAKKRTTGPQTKKGPDVTETLVLPRRDGREKPAHGVSIGEASRVWLRVAALSFGGPAGQIAVMHRILVEEKRWVSESRFLCGPQSLRELHCVVVGPEMNEQPTGLAPSEPIESEWGFPNRR
jgi:Chromate transporter